MDASVIHTVIIVFAILAAFWRLNAKIDANRETIINVRVDLAELKGALLGRATTRSDSADTVATAL